MREPRIVRLIVTAHVRCFIILTCFTAIFAAACSLSGISAEVAMTIFFFSVLESNLIIAVMWCVLLVGGVVAAAAVDAIALILGLLIGGTQLWNQLWFVAPWAWGYGYRDGSLSNTILALMFIVGAGSLFFASRLCRREGLTAASVV